MRTVPSQTGINVLNQFQTKCKVPVRKTKYQYNDQTGINQLVTQAYWTVAY